MRYVQPRIAASDAGKPYVVSNNYRQNPRPTQPTYLVDGDQTSDVATMSNPHYPTTNASSTIVMPPNQEYIENSNMSFDQNNVVNYVNQFEDYNEI